MLLEGPPEEGKSLCALHNVGRKLAPDLGSADG